MLPKCERDKLREIALSDYNVQREQDRAEHARLNDLAQSLEARINRMTDLLIDGTIDEKEYTKKKK